MDYRCNNKEQTVGGITHHRLAPFHGLSNVPSRMPCQAKTGENGKLAEGYRPKIINRLAAVSISLRQNEEPEPEQAGSDRSSPTGSHIPGYSP